MESVRPSPAGKGAAIPPPFRIANACLDGAANVFAVVTELMIFAMLAINAANIVVRNLGFSSLLWVWPWTGVLMIWSVFIAFFVMYRRDMDIRLTFVVQRFAPRTRKILKVFGNLVGLVVVFVILLEVPQILQRQRGVIELVGLQRYWLSVPLILSSALLFLHFILETVGVLLGYESSEFPEDDGANQW
ncbi:TRAP transporter small permease [Rhizobiaceae bacterium BDR2-2]|uniref:TRAP transporter small permease protein n=1 Tax=Ectorhizobium quercum TaxID=2965071 RepID=A0AAE3MZ57_9HYPH|nr:TRAP transporter small permease [Ectorhizobium quercum]MCX8996991.1 TRAP transporter small permease [Ectorhizobium quercum]